MEFSVHLSFPNSPLFFLCLSSYVCGLAHFQCSPQTPLVSPIASGVLSFPLQYHLRSIFRTNAFLAFNPAPLPLTLRFCLIRVFLTLSRSPRSILLANIIRFAAFSVSLVATKRSGLHASVYYPALVYRKRSRPLEFPGKRDGTLEYFRIDLKSSTTQFFGQYENHKPRIVCMRVSVET